MPAIYEMTHDPAVQQVLEEMREKMSVEFGVTVTGNRCTVRWYIDGKLADVHMVIVNVTTPGEDDE